MLPLTELASSRRAVTWRKRASPLMLEAAMGPSDCVSAISTVPEMVLAALIRPAPLIRTSPLMLLALTSPLMSVTLTSPEMVSIERCVPAGALTV